MYRILLGKAWDAHHSALTQIFGPECCLQRWNRQGEMRWIGRTGPDQATPDGYIRLAQTPPGGVAGNRSSAAVSHHE